MINQTKIVATQAMSEAATKATKTEVEGVRGVINNVKQDVQTLGTNLSSKISAVEKVAGNALGKAGEAFTKAANAIGISTEALGAIGKLAGRVFELFNIVATLSILVEQLATLNILGGRIDAVEAEVIAMGNSISRMLGQLFGFQTRITNNEITIGQVRGLATEAKSIGQGAAQLAGAAQVTATRAENFARVAQTTANGAGYSADQAKESAKTAFQKAAEAALQANAATNTANRADTKADASYQKASEAVTTANKATTTANESITKANQATNKAGEAFNKAVEALGTALTLLALYQGLKSLRGLQGIPGIQGIPGLRGLKGEQGVKGLDGAPGVSLVVQIPGTPGRDGINGRDGFSGFPGRPGRDGTPGKNGVDAVPYNDAGLKAFIAAQHSVTRTSILQPIMAVLIPVYLVCKQIFDVVKNLSSAAMLALLNIINNKLGIQVVGGISGFMEAIAKNTYIEKALSVLTFAATMHNALMLSSNIGQTFIMIVDQVTGLILPKGVDGTPINFSEVLGKAVHEIIADTIGEANYKELSEDWQKVNRIYQAASNVFNQVSNLGSVVIAGLEVVAGSVSKIGNALRQWGAVGESAYNFMNPQPNLKGKFFEKLNLTGEKLQAIALVVAVPIALKAALDDTEQSVADLKREIAQIDPKDKDGNPMVDSKGQVIHYKPGLEVPVPIVEEKKALQAKADSNNFLELVLDDIFDGGD